MKILLVSEEVTSRPSEGLLVFIMHLCRYLDENHDLTVLHRHGTPAPCLDSVRILPRKLPVSRKLAVFFRKTSFDIVIYIPSSGLTAFGLLRSVILQRLSGSPIITIAMQDRKTGRLHKLITDSGFRGMILSSANVLRGALDVMGVRTGYMAPGIDCRLFRPVTPDDKSRLRIKYGLPENSFIVLHVGHIRENRNINTFLDYRDWGADVLALVKGGYVDDSCKKRMSEAGVLVMDGYNDDVHELYQASDLYLFPVRSSTGALDLPLSVLEAAACGLPVITTRFGALPDLHMENAVFRYFDADSEIPGLIGEIRRKRIVVSAGVKDYSWDNIFSMYLEPAIEETISSFGRKTR